jgi:hypothetical protein
MLTGPLREPKERSSQPQLSISTLDSTTLPSAETLFSYHQHLAYQRQIRMKMALFAQLDHEKKSCDQLIDKMNELEATCDLQAIFIKVPGEIAKWSPQPISPNDYLSLYHKNQRALAEKKSEYYIFVVNLLKSFSFSYEKACQDLIEQAINPSQFMATCAYLYPAYCLYHSQINSYTFKIIRNAITALDAKHEANESYIKRNKDIDIENFILNGYRMSLFVSGSIHSRSPDELWTPLHFAAFGNDLLQAKVIVRLGLSPNTKDRYHHTPLDIARGNQHDDFVDAFTAFCQLTQHQAQARLRIS